MSNTVRKTAAKRPATKPSKPKPPGVAKDAALAEALGQGVTFEFGGRQYTIPPSDDWDIELVEAFERDRLVEAMKLLLGTEQWEEFRKHHTKLRELNEFFEAATLAAHGGNS